MTHMVTLKFIDGKEASFRTEKGPMEIAQALKSCIHHEKGIFDIGADGETKFVNLLHMTVCTIRKASQ